jgi:hypothetical protein
MAKTPKDEQAIEFQLRPNTAPFGNQGWRGVNTEDDPASLDINQLQYGKDIRFRSKTIETRPGHDLKINLAEAVYYLGELPVVPRTRLWAVVKGCFGTAIGTGSQILHIDPSETPIVQRYSSYFAELDRASPLGVYSGRLYFGDKSMLREVLLIPGNTGQAISSVLQKPINVPIHNFPGFTVRCLLEFDGRFYIGLENDSAPASSKITAWDGAQFIDDLTGIRPPLNFGIWRHRLVAGFDATAANIRWRAAGTPPGSWTTVGLAGFLCADQGNAMQEVRQYLYIASGTDLIHRFDGTSLSLVRTIAGAAVDGFGCTALTLHNGLLYYGWNTPAAAYSSRIGRHDPDSTAANEWVDTYKDISTEVANFKSLQALASYRQSIFAGGAGNWIVATLPNDAKGTMIQVNDTGAPSGTNFPLRQFLIF